ncbi:hypothetical protein ABW19_dt0207628 [Dactylella cylindrospora]|nr:hypothetical protein ABW19_dt0207628 [Dactylella cylindrospora]
MADANSLLPFLSQLLVAKVNAVRCPASRLLTKLGNNKTIKPSKTTTISHLQLPPPATGYLFVCLKPYAIIAACLFAGLNSDFGGWSASNALLVFFFCFFCSCWSVMLGSARFGSVSCCCIISNLNTSRAPNRPTSQPASKQQGHLHLETFKRILQGVHNNFVSSFSCKFFSWMIPLGTPSSFYSTMVIWFLPLFYSYYRPSKNIPRVELVKTKLHHSPDPSEPCCRTMDAPYYHATAILNI